jgi:hypothetical protein
MITLHCVPSLTLPTDIAMHRVVIIPRRPPPFVCEAVRQLQTCLQYVGPCPRSRHEPSPRVNARSKRKKKKNAKPQILHAMTAAHARISTRIKGVHARTLVAVTGDRGATVAPGLT